MEERHESVWEQLDIGRGSLLHSLFRWYIRKYTEGRAAADSTMTRCFVPYVVTASMTYGFMLVAALFLLGSLTERTPPVTDPFLYDWNAMWQYTITFPLLIVLLVNDAKWIRDAISGLVAEGVVKIDDPLALKLKNAWEAKYRRWTIWSQIAGVLVAACVAVVCYKNFTGQNSGIWASAGDTLNCPGWIFLASIAAFYWVLPIYAVRAIATVLVFRELKCMSAITLDRHHPDKCCGLSPLGKISLRFVYLLAVVGINIALLIICVHMGAIGSLSRFMVTGCIVTYLLVGAFLVLGLNLPYHYLLVNKRDELVRNKATQLARINADLDELEGDAERLQTEAHEFIRLRDARSQVKDEIEEYRSMNVWPFDAVRQWKLWAAIIGPIMALLASPLVVKLLG